MKIRFRETVELEVFNSYDEENDAPDTDNEVFSVGDEHDVDIIEDKGQSIDVQFGDGSMAFNVMKAWFEFI